MASADGSIVIDTKLDSDGFTRGVKNIKKEANGLTSVFKKLGSAVASAFAVKALIDFGKQAVELGSNVTEVQNVVDTAFGDMSYKIESFADTAIQNFGMSRLAAKKTASTYMAMGKSMGLTEEAASNMAISLTGLTGDVASFYNISQEVADVKLKGIFTGETEALKELGVVMTQTNLEAYALEQGITKSIDSMTQAEKVALRYGYVTQTLALAQGDFAKTSDSWANQTRILSMQWEEFMSIIGQALITVLTPAVKVLNQIVSSLINMAKAINSLVTNLFGGEQKNTETVTEEIGASVESQEAMTEATKETEKAQKGVLAGFDEINKLASDSATAEAGTTDTSIATISVPEVNIPETENSELLTFFENLAAAVEPFRTAFASAISEILEGGSRIRETFVKVWNDIASLASPLATWFRDDFTVGIISLATAIGTTLGGLLGTVGAIFNNLWDGVIFPSLQRWVDGVPSALNGFIALIEQFVVTAGNVLSGLLTSAGMVFSDLWSIIIAPSIEKWIVDIVPALTVFVSQALTTFNTLFDEVKIIFDRIWQEAIAPALEIIQGIWNDAWDGILGAWDKHGAPIFEKIREAIQNTSDYLQNIWDTIILPIWENIMAVVDKLWTEHLKPLWDNVLDFIVMLAEGAADIYNGFILPMLRWFADTFGKHIVNAFNDTIDKIGDFLGVVADVASYIIDALKGVIDFVVGVFTGDWRRAFEGIKNIFKGIINGMITIVESFCNYFVRAINKVISAANTLSFDVPDWVPLIGGKTWGFNIPKISEVRLPRLAEGAVIPPNSEFLAVLGDQKSGTNIETPLATMVEAFKQAWLEVGGGTDGTVTVVVNLDGREVARNTVRHVNDMTRQAGKPVLLF